MATFIVTCPCCNGRLTIDPALEAVVAHEAPPPPRSGIGLDEALSSLKGAAARRAEGFQEQIKAEPEKPQGPQRKIEEGLQKAHDAPRPPLNPMNMHQEPCRRAPPPPRCPSRSAAPSICPWPSCRRPSVPRSRWPISWPAPPTRSPTRA